MTKTTVKKKSELRRVNNRPRKPLQKAKTRGQTARTAGEIPSGTSPAEALSPSSSPEVLNRLWAIIESRRGADPTVSHAARLLARGTPQIVQKLGEELVECLIEAMAENHAGLVNESADVLYHLLVVWVNAGVQPEEIWSELERREDVSHMTEGVPLKRVLGSMQVGTTKIP